MNKMRRLLALLLVMCLAFGLCACGGGDPAVTDENGQQQGDADDNNAGNSAGDDDGTVTYTVIVTDENGNPIAGAMVQLCKEACIPAVADENGVATFKLAEDTYKVSFVMLPDGYTYSGDETEFYFAEDAFAMTIALKAAA